MKKTAIFTSFALAALANAKEIRNLQDVADTNPGCRKFEGSTCVECSNRYYFGKDGKCTEVDTSCNGYNMQTGACTSCWEGYGDINQNAVDGKCERNEQQDVNKKADGSNSDNGNGNDTSITSHDGGKKNQDNGTKDYKDKKWGDKKKYNHKKYNPCKCHNQAAECISCYMGYYLDKNGYCQELPANCTSASQDGACTACIDGYEVKNGQCVQTNVGSGQCDLTTCRIVNAAGNGCAECPRRAYLQNGCCVPIDGNCKDWDYVKGICLQCYQGYQVDSNDQTKCIESED